MSKIRPENDFRTFEEWKLEGFSIRKGERSILSLNGSPVFNRRQVYFRECLKVPSYVFNPDWDNTDYENQYDFIEPCGCFSLY